MWNNQNAEYFNNNDNLCDYKYNTSKRRRIEKYYDVFVLNSITIEQYINIDPDELIIIYSSNIYSEIFNKGIWECGKKINVKKIITSDSVIVKYFNENSHNFSKIFPNCESIVINSFDNNFYLISRILNDFRIVSNVEYILDDNIYLNNSVFRYKYFFDSFFSHDLSNILRVKIINNVDVNKTKCIVNKNIINNIITLDKIKKYNHTQKELIKKYKIDNINITNILMEYIDINTNTNFKEYLINIEEIIINDL